MQDHEEEEEDVEVVREPEGAEGVAARVLHRKGVHEEDENGEEDAGQT